MASPFSRPATPLGRHIPPPLNIVLPFTTPDWIRPVNTPVTRPPTPTPEGHDSAHTLSVYTPSTAAAEYAFAPDVTVAPRPARGIDAVAINNLVNLDVPQDVRDVTEEFITELVNAIRRRVDNQWSSVEAHIYHDDVMVTFSNDNQDLPDYRTPSPSSLSMPALVTSTTETDEPYPGANAWQDLDAYQDSWSWKDETLGIWRRLGQYWNRATQSWQDFDVRSLLPTGARVPTPYPLHQITEHDPVDQLVNDDDKSEAASSSATTVMEVEDAPEVDWHNGQQGTWDDLAAQYDEVNNLIAAAAQQSEDAARTTPVLRCHACGQSGHPRRQCPTRHRNIRCNYCRQRGHIRRDCPVRAHRHEIQREREEQQRVQEAAETLVNMRYIHRTPTHNERQREQRLARFGFGHAIPRQAPARTTRTILETPEHLRYGLMEPQEQPEVLFVPPPLEPQLVDMLREEGWPGESDRQTVNAGLTTRDLWFKVESIRRDVRLIEQAMITYTQVGDWEQYDAAVKEHKVLMEQWSWHKGLAATAEVLYGSFLWAD